MGSTRGLRRASTALAGMLCLAGALGITQADATQVPAKNEPARGPGGLPAIDSSEISALVRRTMKERGVPSFSVGIVAGDRLVYGKAFGRLNEDGDRARLDSLYQIGSITKTFTALLMCALRDDGLLRLDDPVSRFLPGVPMPADAAGAPQITLRHLATHTSGLPGNPVNRRDLPGTPSVMLPYSVEELYAGLAGTRLEAPVGRVVRYSNLGFGLLGHVLERAAGGENTERESDFETLVRERITDPLGMPDTRILLSPRDERRLAAHYWPGAPRVAQPRWHFGEVSGFGGLTSSVPDLARYVAFQLGALAVDREPVSLATRREMHTPQRVLDRRWNRGIGLAWFVEPTELGSLVYHGGELDGHSSFIGFLPEHGVGVIVLANQGRNVAEALGKALVKGVMDVVRSELDTLAAHVDDGRWEDALPLAQALAARSPHDGPAAFRLGMLLLELDRADAAHAAFETSYRVGYQRPESAFNIARCHARRGRSDAAVDALQQAYQSGFRDVRFGPTSPDFDGLHADPRFRAWVVDRFPRTGRLFFDVIAEGASAVLARFRADGDAGLGEAETNQLGYQLLFRGLVDDAIEVFRFNVDAYPRSWNVYDSLGEAYMNARQDELAIDNYRRSIELNPRNANGKRILERLEASGGGTE